MQLEDTIRSPCSESLPSCITVVFSVVTTSNSSSKGVLSLVFHFLIYCIVILHAIQVDLLYVPMWENLNVQIGVRHFICKIVLHIQKVAVLRDLLDWSCF